MNILLIYCLLKTSHLGTYIYPKQQRDTQVLSIGKHGQDHTAVIDYYHKEIEDLKNGFDCYFGYMNKVKRIALGLLYHSADRPERQSIMNTLGEGDYGKITNYAADISVTKLPACQDCYKHLITNLRNNSYPEHSCKKCLC